MKVLVVIPARMASTRFPNKPMAKILGVPMIGHCYLRSKLSKSASDIVVATCDTEIADYISTIGGVAILTSDKHERATERTAEALLKYEEQTGKKFDVIAMVQGDEPLVAPEMVDDVARPFFSDRSLKVVNLMTPIHSQAEFENPNAVKTVVDLKNRALYMSREPIPSRKKWNKEMKMWKQLGIIAFSRAYLLEYIQTAPTPLEQIESVDMMRSIENGVTIQMVAVSKELVGVDTPSDLERAEQLMADDHLVKSYQGEVTL